MSKEKTTIIIPFKNVGDEDELRFALRSIERNVKFDYKIVIIGDAPKWIDTERVTVLNPELAPEAINPKAFDVIKKMRFACENKEITGKIVMTYDDIVFLNPVKAADMSTPIALGMIPEDPTHPWTGSPAWVQVMQNTIAALKRNKMTMLNFETHLPRVFFKDKLAALFQKFGFKKRAYMLPTLYFNEYHKVVSRLDRNPKNIKIGLYFDDDFEKRKEDFKTHLFLNWSSSQWTPELKAYLFELFPEKSRFEI